MEKHLADADYIVMVCTDKYVEKANAGKGGVGYEKMIVTAELLSNIDSNKIVPVIRQYGTRNVPTFLKTKLFINLSHDDNYEFGFDELVRTFHNAPIFKKPEIGNNPFTSSAENPPEKTGDAIYKLMKHIIADFEKGYNWTDYRSLVEQIDMSRIMLDSIIDEAFEQGLISEKGGALYLQEKGKQYAVKHKLV